MTQDMNHTITKVLKAMLVAAMISLAGGNAIAQVKVKGNVYGGGNAADVQTNTEVNISAGSVEGNVYGGGNLGDVGRIDKTDASKNYKWTVDENGNTTSTYNNTGSCKVEITGGTIGADGKSTANHASGHVFGAGKGATSSFYCEEGMVYTTSVTISKGTVYGNVYGGGEVGRVENNTTVTIGASSGTDEFEIKGGVFGAGAGVATHGYSALVRGDATVTVQGKAKVEKSVYGGGEIASVGRFKVENSLPTKPLSGGTCTVTIQGDAKVGTGSEGGSVYGACKGVEPDYENNGSAGHVINTGESKPFANEAEYLAFLKTLALTSNTVVTIGGSTSVVNGSVYGGGQRGITLGSVAVNVAGGTVTNDVYGGGALADTNTGNWHADYGEVAGLTVGESDVTEFYERSGAGTTADPYNYTKTTDTKAATGKTYYSINTWAHVTEKSALYKTTVSLTGGSVRNVYGGGLGDLSSLGNDHSDVAALVYGDVLVDLNGTTTYDTNGRIQTTPISTKGCVVTNVFGCNNVNGTPKGEVLVHVHATQKSGGSSITDKTTGTYDVKAVYGGGNQAEYYPVRADATDATEANHVHTNVIVDGCTQTSIEAVYGGGNAASTPATSVIINGAYEIGEVFGGGNGYGDNNPGANVGFHAYDAESEAYDTPAERLTRKYGFGKAQVNVGGGTIHAVFGGSNSKGNVREVAIAMLDENDDNCTFVVGRAYGGGKAAEMDGRAVLQLGCVPQIDEVYGGAESAAIHNDVELTITNGTYKRIFGGNNKSGSIDGKITINIEETGCTPIVIGQIFAGGNEAAYTTPSGKADPVINVKSFTSIGQIFGGGFGPTAVLTGNPTIYIDEIVGDKATDYTATTFSYDNGTVDTSDDYTVVVPAHTADKIGTIGDVYGGGYGADVVGNVTVNIGTQETITFVGDAPTRTGLTVDNSGNYSVTGVDIARSVYGGGYGAATTVTGNVKVNVGGEKTESGTTTFTGGTITIGESVYGGSALGAVNATRGTSGLSKTDDATTTVTLKKGTITGAVYGGGMGKEPTNATSNDGVNAKVYGDATVSLYGDVVAGGIYGGCNLNGAMKGDVQLDLLGGRVGAAFTATTTPTEIPNIVFGGGLGALTTVEGDVTVNVNNSTKTPDGVAIYSNVYGGSKNGSVATTSVNLLGGVIWGDVFGGGYETASNATAATNATVTLNGTAFGITYEKDDNNKDVPKTGRIFGCNNLQGSPTGNVTVNVEKTTDLDADHAKTASDKLTSTTASDHYYNVQAVYGGGNLAPYVPTVSGAKSQVNIRGCSDTSIEYVYGGGNAAAMGTADNRVGANLNVEGAYEIGYTFGGGNGSDRIKSSTTESGWTENPGANVYGDATSTLVGGFIHNVFGASNTKGTITGEAKIDIDEIGNGCELITENVHGAGMNADVEGDINLRIGCLADNVKNVYGGAMAAKINGNVTLTITSGILDNVYGGNNESGSISGKITVNIEEVDACKPIVIGNLYGGGNLAAYPGPDLTNNDPNIEVNVKSFTSIGNVYGGGRGAGAVVTGNTVVNIDEVKGRWAGTARDAETLTINGVDVYIPEHKAGEIGAIGNVYGGGDLAKVDGSTKVTIGAKSYEALTNITAGVTDVTGYYTRSGAGTTESPYVYTKVTPTAPETTVIAQASTDYYMAYLGANITNNVYGGGNLADVSGNTEVIICAKKDEGETDYHSVALAEGAAVTVAGDVFGAGKGNDTDVTKALVEGESIVVMGNGSVKKSVYGGGELSQVAGNTDVSVIGGTIGTTSLGGATYGNVYGGGKGNITDVAAGLIKSNTKIAISGGTILHNIYGGGAYGSVGTFTYDTDNTNDVPDGTITSYTSGGKAVIEITGGTIGTTGKENGMVFGSSRGDVGGSGEIHDRLAWVYDTEVKIGTSGVTTGPQINGSIYGGGENGHNYRNADVYIYSGTIGITENVPITSNNGTPNDPTDDITYNGAEYPYRGNVYGGGCGTDKYYSYTPIPDGHTATDGEGDKYNPLAGIVQGDATITIAGGTIVHNVYGAGAMGSVGKFEKDATTNAITFASGGKTTIDISGGTIGVSGTVGDGNVYGAARGDKDVTDRDLALVKETSVTISGTTTTTQIKGNVYGGGEVGNVHTNTKVDIQGGAIARNVFGGGKGVEDLFTCEQAMVGVEGEGAGADLDTDANKIKGTSVTISNGTVGTLSNAGALVEGTGNVYGGGEIGRVEWNTQVKIGVGTGEGTFAPVIYGSVFGAGKGLETHGYSALVRGNSTVSVQGNAKVEHNVYGGGEKSTVGRYWVKGINNNVTGAPTAPSDLPDGMPYQQQSGGICRVFIQGNAQIGPDGGASDFAGHVFGAGKGVEPHFVESGTGQSQKMTGTNVLVGFTAENGKTAEELYLEFLQTLALATNSYVTIDGSANVKGSVMGGSENGFVQADANVTIQGSCEIGTTTYGNVYGGGRGLSTFAEAGKVKGNTMVAVKGGAVKGNVYGGGSLGDVGIIDKTDKKDGQLTYNYKWKKTDGTTANDTKINQSTDLNTNTGICKVTISGGTIGISGTESSEHGNVFGAGKGLENTWWCEKAIAYATNVSITKGTVYGNVYGGGQIGRVEDDAKVTIGTPNGTDEFEIKGSVFGAGAGLATHGYSALVRGNADVTIQGKAQIGGSVYGGGETASVGKFYVDKGLPKYPLTGGTCTVIITDNASITGEVFGACKGVDPTTIAEADRKSMQLYTNRPSNASLWSHYNNDEKSPFIWRTYSSEADYLAFLETLALTSNTDVTVNGSAIIGESVYGGGQRGITLGTVEVGMLGGTVNKDVYGGGALANTNAGNWDNEKYVEATGLTVGESVVTGLYTRSGSNTEQDPYVYTEIIGADTKAASGTTYYIKGAWADGKTSANYTTTVNLKGGMIKGDAYGGGLGQLGTNPIEAKVYGDVYVNQGTANVDEAPATAYTITYLTDNTDTSKPLQVVNSGRIFGCNNLNGSPKGNVTVTVNRTVAGNKTRTAITRDSQGKVTSVADNHTYEVAAVYGGGNLADYTPENGSVKVIINSCDVSIEEVYGGGNAAMVPGTDVLVNGAHEIEHVFGGGNGKDRYYLNNFWNENPGANVNGDVNTLLKGGLIHEAYGGSNEKGTITGNITIDTGTDGLAGCPVQVDKLVAAGKNADVEGDLIVILGCKNSTKIPLVYGGADNANVKGNVELTITSGNFGKVFGGNNEGGSIFGHITLNIEETSECEPIRIDELYLGGNDAAYSIYGYYQDGTDANNKPIYKPRTAEMHSITDTSDPKYKAPAENPANDATHTFPYAQPVLNVISATSIGQVFGGGYGEDGDMYADPTVNINMIPGYHAVAQLGGAHKLCEVGDVYGGGNAADVVGNTTVNIGTAKKVTVKSMTHNSDNTYTAGEANVEGAHITGNVYGGGKLADVTGKTNVNICAVEDDNPATTDVTEYASVTIQGTDYEGVTIGKNVYGGGKGEARESGDRAFFCEEAMVGVDGMNKDKNTNDSETYANYGTHVRIGNGTVNGTVFGGGEIGRVEFHTDVTIGYGNGTGAATKSPVIHGNVFGAGKGANTHGYSGLVRGDSKVIIQGDAKVDSCVYGGGEMASVGKYEVVDGLPKTPLWGGVCTVTIQGNAEIGPDDMQMVTESGKPDDTGHVFGAGKGILPYEGYAANETPYSVQPTGKVEYTDEAAYLRFIRSLGLASNTEVTIDGNAFVKGSVYGGSENGYVQANTHVTIASGQIGAGFNPSTKKSLPKYAETAFFDPTETAVTESNALAECAHWPYESPYAPYDIFDYQTGTTKPKPASDGHTFYGNVFGGGRGYYPYSEGPALTEEQIALGYSKGLWLRAAGSVGGNTVVDITGGHILTSAYGGNEQTDVTGSCTINMTGGTVGVPRTNEQKLAHPVVGNLFGAGKGDQRVNFNTWTNVASTQVNISGTARIYGSTFGGGEDGHILGDAETNIGGTVKIGETNYTHSNVVIGTTGTSYTEGNVFGGGRGFSGDAQTAGTVGGNIEVNIENGKILGSVYGGGRLASVGTLFTDPNSEFYGQFKEDDTDGTYGHITINISGGTIGNSVEDIKPETANIPNTITESDISKWKDDDWMKWKTYNNIPHTLFDRTTGLLAHSTGGNVFGGSMGRLTRLNNEINPLWPKLAQVKTCTISITGGTIKHNVYGGGELGTVREDAKITIEDGTIGRDVYGGGYGSDDYKTKTPITVAGYAQTDYTFTPMQWAGCVGGDTYVDIKGGHVRKSVYGGGEMASVGIINYTHAVKNDNKENGFILSWPYKVEYLPFVDGGRIGGATYVSVTGGRIGAKSGDDDFDTDNGDVYGAGKGIAGDYNDYVFCANVRSTNVTINMNSDGVTPKNYEAGGNCVAGAVYGGGENGHVMENTLLTLKNGLVGHSIYGGGSGKGKFDTRLLKIGAPANSTNPNDSIVRNIYSITAGKVFGNTEILMEGGQVVRNVYGGGNMGSVGKGNYAGGADDYSTAGYGEKLSGNLWDGVSDFSKAFLNSGKCTVHITGGTIGYIDETDPSNTMYPWNSTASLPYGNVFGGCRGESAPNISESPRYLYSPEFFVGYANETDVTIEGDDTKILGSVYGGGMDGHIRRDTHVIIDGGEIGLPFTDANKTKVKTIDPNDIQWLARGNVYGAGSGIGKYKYDFNYDGAYTSTVTYNGKQTKEEDFSTSAGSVTRFTKVEVQGGTIHRNVYGGGSLASVGAPKIGQSYLPYRQGDTEEGHGQGKQSLNQVIISGDATIGDAGSFAAGYGGYVFGSSRGDENLSNPASYATAVWTDVNVDGGTIAGDVYGGGEVGSVRQSTEVKLTGGVIKHDAYGGGKGTTTVAANVGGDALVKLNEGKGAGNTGAIVSRIFGANNLNGSPQGNTSVYVYATQSADSEHTTIGSKFAKHADVEVEGATSTYDVMAVYGGGNEAAYVPASPYTATNTTGAKSQVIIEGCDLTSIKTVYGGGNAASVPETNVIIKSAYEIEDVFGGGNGKDKKSDGSDNPGADIGVYKNASAESVRYGTGNVNVNAEGGYIHELFGASNQKGDIKGDVNLKMQQVGDCTLKIDKVYNAGRNADIEGNLISVLSCQPTEKVLEYYGGAENANVKGNVELTITNGWFGKVFAGNNQSGAILGHIKLNVEETGCNPIKIDELYGCGNDAAYSVYGYYVKTTETDGKGLPTETADLLNDKLVLLPRTSADDPHLPVKTFNSTEHTWTVYGGTSEEDTFKPYADPELNIVSATYIGQVFGGGYGEHGHVYGNPTVNINMIPGEYASDVPAFAQGENIDVSDNSKKLGIIGDVYGGGNAADVIGDPTVNIGTADKVNLHLSWDKTGGYTMSEDKTVEGAYITGDVFGGGMGKDDTFTCEKAMVGIDGDGIDHPNGGTTVNIGNGMVLGNVYGGGEIGRVEKNTAVMIGLQGNENSAPIIKGNVFGGGKGKETHGYSALVRGNPTVIVQGNAKIKKSVYGGGEIASVARYKVAETDEEAAANGVKKGMPYALKSTNSGYCTVIVRDNAEIGPDGMQMTAADGPDDSGYVFGAGKGILPKVYTYEDNDHKPKRMVNNGGTSEWEYFANENAYIQFIQTLALATHTDVTISGNAFVKGSVYGGSENGLVQYDTDVKIEGGQIGCGKNTTERYGDEVWGAGYTPTTDLDCQSWEYKSPFAPFDPYAKYKNPEDGKYYYDAAYTKYAEGGASIATDGHTYYGNVFGGGSGSIPYFDTIEGRSEYLSSAGQVKGNTNVTISGGHILTNVYGGCEATNVSGTANVTMTGGTVGVPRTDDRIVAHPLTGYLFGAGKGDQRIFFNKETNVNHAVVKVEGGRIYGSVYGGGEDGHVLGNVTMTIGKAESTTVPTIGMKGTSYYDGHVFGGGRGFGGDALTAGNVGGSVTMTIHDGKILGSVYGGGRLASVGYGLYLTSEEGYGEMRDDDKYDGSYTDPSTEPATTFFNKGRGYIDITINGGTIGNDAEYVYDSASKVTHTKGGNVFAGSMGSLYKQDGTTTNSQWAKFAHAKQTKLTINGGTIKSCVYGGGELGAITKNTDIKIEGGTIGTEIGSGDNRYYFGSVFGGGYGSTIEFVTDEQNVESNPKLDAGIIHGDTKVTMTDGAVMASVYGGGEVASVEGSTDLAISGGTIGVSGFGGIEIGNVYGGGKGDKNIVRAGHIFGNTKIDISEAEGKTTQIWHNIYGGGAYGTVGDFDYETEHNDEFGTDKVTKVKGLKEGTTGGTAMVTITGGTIGRNGKENGMVFGSSRGDVGAPGSRDDLLAWTYDTKVEISGSAKIMGSVYGGGENGHNFNNADVTIHGGTIGIADGSPIDSYAGAAYPYRGNVYGAGCGTDKYYIGEIPEGHTATDGEGDEYNPLAGIVQGNTTITIDGGTIVHNVYGAGAMGSVGVTNADGTTSGGKTTINITGGRIGHDGNDNGHVFGAARGDINVTGEGLATVRETEVTIHYNSTPEADDSEHTTQLIAGSVFGGGEAGSVSGPVTVNLLGGYIQHDVYGGGALANTNTVSGSTIVNALGGKVNDIFGGGLGQKKDVNGTSDIEAKVYGNVTVNLNGLESADYVPALHSTLVKDVDTTDDAYYRADDGCVVTGKVFGCNNYNGTPLGHAKVHVFKTTGLAAGDYDVAAVYGGGNQADYVPTDTKQSTEVIIEGCDLTSIEEVYGGGYGAATPGTNVLVKGTKIINNVYGGGYGAGTNNPGANVGIMTSGGNYTSGEGKAVVRLMAGTVNNVYGGSNTKGDIRGGSSVTNVANDGGPGCCDKLTVAEIYGGGKSADMYGGAEIVLGCMPNDWIGAIYAGAENADIGGDVGLTLTSGKFERVFGGNNMGGTIDGYIEVNIEENPECETPIIIGGLYGGGNMAPYTVPKKYTENNPNYPSPRVNVRAFTSIGNIYGGGFGADAKVTGNPLVNINQVEGGREYAGETKVLEDGSTVTLYPRAKDAKMGVIGNVFGGGNAAPVDGNTTVNIGTESEQEMESLKTMDAEGHVTVVKKPVIGVDIRGNVYGGGNQAEVTGDTNVVVGQEKR